VIRVFRLRVDGNWNWVGWWNGFAPHRRPFLRISGARGDKGIASEWGRFRDILLAFSQQLATFIVTVRKCSDEVVGCLLGKWISEKNSLECEHNPMYGKGLGRRIILKKLPRTEF
jgi:hypothetical protein